MAKAKNEENEEMIDDSVAPVNPELEGETVIKSDDTVKILLTQYFERYASKVHPYTQSFILASYHGILKSKEEWDKELTGKF